MPKKKVTKKVSNKRSKSTNQKPQSKRKSVRKHTPKFLQKMREFLLEKRSLLTNDIRRMESDLNVTRPSVIGEFENATFEEELIIGLIEAQERDVINIDKALVKISNGGYGLCIDCNEPIETARLKCLPAAERCLSCRRIFEENLL